jgi:tRNA(adenine34) deaminase
MQYALSLAHQAKAQGEVPVGAVIIRDNIKIGEGFNRPIATHDPTAHAEIQAIRMATLHDNNYRLSNAILYVTLEPCVMCAGAIIQARIAKVVFGARDPKGGAAGSVFNVLQNNALNHQSDIKEGLLEVECGKILSEFFKERRKVKESQNANISW